MFPRRGRLPCWQTRRYRVHLRSAYRRPWTVRPRLPLPLWRLLQWRLDLLLSRHLGRSVPRGIWRLGDWRALRPIPLGPYDLLRCRRNDLAGDRRCTPTKLDLCPISPFQLLLSLHYGSHLGLCHRRFRRPGHSLPHVQQYFCCALNPRRKCIQRRRCFDTETPPANPTGLPY